MFKDTQPTFSLVSFWSVDLDDLELGLFEFERWFLDCLLFSSKEVYINLERPTDNRFLSMESLSSCKVSGKDNVFHHNNMDEYTYWTDIESVEQSEVSERMKERILSERLGRLSQSERK